jgi:hypothetical protein
MGQRFRNGVDLGLDDGQIPQSADGRVEDQWTGPRGNQLRGVLAAALSNQMNAPVHYQGLFVDASFRYEDCVVVASCCNGQSNRRKLRRDTEFTRVIRRRLTPFRCHRRLSNSGGRA